MHVLQFITFAPFGRRHAARGSVFFSAILDMRCPLCGAWTNDRSWGCSANCEALTSS